MLAARLRDCETARLRDCETVDYAGRVLVCQVPCAFFALWGEANSAARIRYVDSAYS